MNDEIKLDIKDTLTEDEILGILKFTRLKLTTDQFKRIIQNNIEMDDILVDVDDNFKIHIKSKEGYKIKCWITLTDIIPQIKHERLM